MKSEWNNDLTMKIESSLKPQSHSLKQLNVLNECLES